jgi:CheY-like chemotaxis protein
MKILIIDRDRAAAQVLQGKLQQEGHQVVIEAVRKTAGEMLQEENFDCVFIDPAPLPSARPFTMQLRWEQRERYQYIVLMGYEPDSQEILRAGLNAILPKPIDVNVIGDIAENAGRLVHFARKIQYEPEIQSVDDHMFGRRAMAQLMLSALDRTYRYGEQAFLLKITLANALALEEKWGVERLNQLRADFMAAIGQMRRLSDLLGRTDEDECVLLMQRPWQPNEPKDAAERFAVVLNEFREDPANQARGAIFNLELWELPAAKVVMRMELAG